MLANHCIVTQVLAQALLYPHWLIGCKAGSVPGINFGRLTNMHN
jgi:hypothetical protein